MAYLRPPRDPRGPRRFWSVPVLGGSAPPTWPPLRFGSEPFAELVRAYETGRGKREWKSLEALLLLPLGTAVARIVGHVSAESANRWVSRKHAMYVVEFCGRLLFCLPGGAVVAELSTEKP